MELPMAALLLSGVGTGLSVISTIQQGQYADDVGKYQARVAEDNAKLVEAAAQEDKRRAFESGAAEEKGFRRQSQARLSTSIANIGKSGVTLAGSPLMVLNEMATNLELDARGIQSKYKSEISDIGYNAYIKARDLRMGGAMNKIQGTNTKNQAYGQATGTLLKGAGTMLNGYNELWR